MAIAKMKRLRLLGMRADREELLRRAQRLGCVELSEPAIDLTDPDWAALTRPDGQELAQARERSAVFVQALEILKRYDKPKEGLFASRPEVSERELFDEQAYSAALETARAILDEERTVTALAAECGKVQAQKAALAPWLSLDVPLEMEGDGNISLIYGVIPAKTELSAAEAAVAEVTELAQLYPAGSDRDLRYFLAVCHVTAVEACTEALRPLGFSQANLRGWTGTAADNDRALDRQLAALTEQTEQARARILALAPRRELICRCADRAAQDVAREEAKERLIDTGETFLLEGWIRAASEEELVRMLGDFPCAWETRDPAVEEYPDVPVKLENNRLTRCMNVVTEMYSLPAYDGTDPNPLMFPFFVLFFGMMMADMGYGILMILAAALVLKSKPREGTRNFMEGVFWCGVSTLLWGAATGGFFGDFIPQIARIINPDSTLQLPALFTPLDDTVAIMLGSVVLGCIQIITGMTVSIVNKIRAGNFLDALFDEITWWIILGGAALAVFGIGTVAGVPVVLVAGILMLVFGGTRQAKGFGKLTKLVGLVYNGVTGFFSDALSYVRLMALMLSGSVIASVFNTLGATFGNVILFVVIAMIGNALNLALNLLGCYVHDLRLQCLEFFNRFYKEGGRAYRPLAIKTNYVDIIKEEHENGSFY